PTPHSENPHRAAEWARQGPRGGARDGPDHRVQDTRPDQGRQADRATSRRRPSRSAMGADHSGTKEAARRLAALGVGSEARRVAHRRGSGRTTQRRGVSANSKTRPINFFRITMHIHIPSTMNTFSEPKRTAGLAAVFAL